MAKVLGIKKAKISVQKKLTSVSKDDRLLDEIGEFAVERIKFFARKGTPLRINGSIGRFPPLKDVTLAIRTILAKYNLTHPAFQNDIPNVTFTGQLVDHVKYEKKDGYIDIFIEGTRRPILDKFRKPIVNQELKSEKIYEDLLRLNPKYSFLGMDFTGKDRIKKIIERNLRRLLKK
jgi:hypothetical protein